MRDLDAALGRIEVKVDRILDTLTDHTARIAVLEDRGVRSWLHGSVAGGFLVGIIEGAKLLFAHR